MRPPLAGARLWWCSGGDVMRPHPRRGAEAVPSEAAARLLALHRRALATAPPGAVRAFHAAHASALAATIAAAAAWRRAAASPCRSGATMQS